MGLEKKKITRRNAIMGAAALGAAGILLKGDDENHMRESLDAKREKELTPFERRYQQRALIGGEMTEIIDAAPEEDKGLPSLLFAPGWQASVHLNALSMDELHKRGRRVLSLNHPPRGNVLTALLESDRNALKEFPSIEIQKASNLIELLERQGINAKNKADCIAFSEASLNSVIAASVRPDLFRNIVLYAPAGLIGQDSLIGFSKPGLMRRFQAQVKSNEAGRHSLEARRPSPEEVADAKSKNQIAIDYPEIKDDEVAQHIGENWDSESHPFADPVRSFQELRALAYTQIDELIQRVRSSGIGVIIMTGVDDEIFPAKIMAERLKKGEIDGFLAVRDRHGARHLFAADQMLQALKKKQEKSASH